MWVLGHRNCHGSFLPKGSFGLSQNFLRCCFLLCCPQQKASSPRNLLRNDSFFQISGPQAWVVRVSCRLLPPQAPNIITQTVPLFFFWPLLNLSSLPLFLSPHQNNSPPNPFFHLFSSPPPHLRGWARNPLFRLVCNCGIPVTFLLRPFPRPVCSHMENHLFVPTVNFDVFFWFQVPFLRSGYPPIKQSELKVFFFPRGARLFPRFVFSICKNTQSTPNPMGGGACWFSRDCVRNGVNPPW